MSINEDTAQHEDPGPSTSLYNVNDSSTDDSTSDAEGLYDNVNPEESLVSEAESEDDSYMDEDYLPPDEELMDTSCTSDSSANSDINT
jgi:hypothetical protein